jgi:glycosyltransferase involved in cell wall biosynthesis
MIPVASVVMPFLNQQAYLAEAIDSVRAQTLDSWELLLVDDGSTDHSPTIAKSYALADPSRIKLLHHPDGRRHGAAAARNLGLRQARGEFIAFLDADDVYECDKLETDVALLGSRPEAAMLYGPTWWWYPGATRPVRPDRVGVEPGRVYPPPELAIRILLGHEGAVPCTCAVLIRRATAVAVGGFEQEFKLYEDQTLWAKLFLRYPVLVAGRPTARYRQHDASTSAQAARTGEYHDWRQHEAEARFLEWFLSYSEGAADPALARALNRALAPYRRRSAAAARTARYFVKRIATGVRHRAERLLVPKQSL